MMESRLDWSSAYVVPTELCFRPTSAGSLLVDNGRPGYSVEISRGHVNLLLPFARVQIAEEAYQRAAGRWKIDRESFGLLLELWIANGLLRSAASQPYATTRLAVFAGAMEEYLASPARRFPLRSHFALQRPTVFFPGLETREIHDQRRFPWVTMLEDSFSLIQAEFEALLDSTDFSRVHDSFTSTGEWAAAYLWVFGEQVEDTCRSCPRTTQLLSSIPGVAQFGTTLFSALGHHSHIAPHYGYTNAKLRCQLPLRVPQGCRLKVGDREVEQREGRCILFDDSFLHSAWNDSPEPRFVLLFDFFHPDLTPDEIQYLAQFAAERKLAKPYLAQAAAGEKAGWVRS